MAWMSTRSSARRPLDDNSAPTPSLAVAGRELTDPAGRSDDAQCHAERQCATIRAAGLPDARRKPWARRRYRSRTAMAASGQAGRIAGVIDNIRFRPRRTGRWRGSTIYDLTTKSISGFRPRRRALQRRQSEPRDGSCARMGADWRRIVPTVPFRAKTVEDKPSATTTRATTSAGGCSRSAPCWPVLTRLRRPLRPGLVQHRPAREGDRHPQDPGRVDRRHIAPADRPVPAAGAAGQFRRLAAGLAGHARLAVDLRSADRPQPGLLPRRRRR